MFRLIRLWSARARLRRIHEDVEHLQRDRERDARALDRLLSDERRTRSTLFALEHPHLFQSRPTCVYGAPVRSAKP